MSAFPDTPVSLLARLAAERTGQSQADWTRFFELYQPVIEKFAAFVGAKREAEDVSQDIFLKLVEVFRNSAYAPSRGSFRAYLATMIRREVVNRWHKANVRAADRHISIDNEEHPVELAAAADPALALDVRWRLARHAAAVEHVLTKTALAERSKAIYRAYVLEERPIGEVAAAFGVPNNTVSQTKTRVERMIAEHEALPGDEATSAAK